MSSCGKWVWSPPDNATPLDFPAPKSWLSDLSVEVLFVSVLIFLSEYWKRLQEMLVQKQMIPQKKGLIISFLELVSLRAWRYQEGTTPTCRKKQFFFVFYNSGEGFWLFAFYDLSRRLLLNYNILRVSYESWIIQLSSEVSFISVLGS